MDYVQQNSSYVQRFYANAKSIIKNKKARLSFIYALLLLILYCASFYSPMDDKGLYIRVVTFVNLIGITAFYLQFPLACRLKNIPLFNRIDWSIPKHKTMGYWVGGIFFLHPFLILAPKMLLSGADGWLALKTAITSSALLTGIIAWVLLALWVLFSAVRKRLPMRYEVWRFLHSLGFVVITILATFHITAVGSHGQLQNTFNITFWVLCIISVAATAYNYLIKPIRLEKSPFKVVSINKISSSDWNLTLTSKDNKPFKFEAGQFVWLNTGSTAYHIDNHPFSIASSTAELPNISFIIRELGDYTRNLNKLSIGQTVYLDGPFGQMNLDESKKSNSIIFIAGGAGIAPMLGLIKQLAYEKDPRPIRLIYGNAKWQQMSAQDDIHALENAMPNFKQHLICQENTHDQNICQGVINKNILEDVIVKEGIADKCAIYLCGPEGMITAVTKDLAKLNIAKNDIHFEQLSF